MKTTEELAEIGSNGYFIGRFGKSHGDEYQTAMPGEQKGWQAAASAIATAVREERAEEVERLREALSDLLHHADKVTCTHDETYRGGIIWEICEFCGAKWADDRGGKPEWKEPSAMAKARKALEGK